MCAARSKKAFDDRADLLHGVLYSFSLSDQDAAAAVARIHGGTRHDQIAHAGETRQRFLTPAHCFGKTGNLRERACHQQRFCVVAQTCAVADAAAQRHNVFERTGKLHAHHIVMRVDAEHIIHENALHGFRHALLLRRSDTAGRYSERDLLGVRGSGEHGNRTGPLRLFAKDFRHAKMRLLLYALRQRNKDRAAGDVRRRRPRDPAQGEGRRGENEQLAVLQALEVVRDRDLFRDRHVFE